MLESQITLRVKVLEEFLALLRSYVAAENAVRRAEQAYNEAALASASGQLQQLRSRINRATAAAAAAAEQANVGTTLIAQAPATVGGRTSQIALFDNVFGDFFGEPMLPHVATVTEKAIGAYEAMGLDPTLGQHGAAAPLDILNAIRRALRPSFRSGAPKSEREVQDAIEVILQAAG